MARGTVVSEAAMKRLCLLMQKERKFGWEACRLFGSSTCATTTSTGTVGCKSKRSLLLRGQRHDEEQGGAGKGLWRECLVETIASRQGPTTTTTMGAAGFHAHAGTRTTRWMQTEREAEIGSRSFASSSSSSSSSFPPSHGAMTLESDFRRIPFVAQIVRSPDERVLWEVVLAHQGEFDRTETVTIAKQLGIFAKNKKDPPTGSGSGSRSPSDLQALRKEGLQAYFRALDQHTLSFRSVDIEDIVLGLGNYSQIFRDAKLPSKLGERLLGSYLEFPSGQKSIRRFIYGSLNCLEDPIAKTAIFEALLNQLVGQPISRSTTRDVANSLWLLRRAKVKLSHESILQAVYHFLGAHHSRGSHSNHHKQEESGIGSSRHPFQSSSAGEWTDNNTNINRSGTGSDTNSVDMVHFSQVWSTFKRVVPAKPTQDLKERYRYLAEELVNVMVKRHYDEFLPNHCTLVADGVHSVFSKCYDPSQDYSSLSSNLLALTDKFLSMGEIAKPKEVAVLFCATEWKKMLPRSDRQNVNYKLVRLFHSLRGEATHEELGNIFRSVCSYGMGQGRERGFEGHLSILQDLLNTFMSDHLDQAGKKEISHAVNFSARYSMKINRDQIIDMMQSYERDPKPTNTFQVGILMWALYNLHRKNRQKALFAFESTIFNDLFSEFIECMEVQENASLSSSSSSSQVGVTDPIHISQALQGLVVPHQQEVNMQEVKVVIGALLGFARKGECNAQVLANSLSSLRKVVSLRAQSFDEESKEAMRELFSILVQQHQSVLNHKLTNSRKVPKMNEIAQAVSAVADMNIHVGSKDLELACQLMVKIYEESDVWARNKYGGTSLAKMMYYLSLMEEVSGIEMSVRTRMMDLWQDEHREDNRNDRFKVQAASENFLRHHHHHHSLNHGKEEGE